MPQINWKEVFVSLKDFTKASIKKYTLWILHLSPHQNLLHGVLLYTLLGWVALSLPFMNAQDISWLDNLFTAASAATTTGLTSVSTADGYTWLGQLVILILIQAGGLGYMTMSSFVFLSMSRRLRPHQKEVLSAEFSLPQELNLHDFLRAAIIFTVVVESLGAVFLFNYFMHHNYGIFQAAWYSIFHSISAFCTAGFSLWSDNLIQFYDSKTMNIIISLLSLLGAIGFIVVTDVFNWITRRAKGLSYTSKIILLTISSVVLFGTVMLYITNPVMSLWEAFFQATAAMTTAGFNTVEIGAMSTCSLLVMIILMSIGGAPSGTGGGIKSTAFASVMAILYNRLLGRKHISFLDRRIPIQKLYLATSTFIFYTILLLSSVFWLTYCEQDKPFLSLFFEAASALATAGLSMEFTSQLSAWGKIIIIITMIIGRVGVITFGMALLRDDDDEPEPEPTEKADLAI